jgi:hypothetical protein
MKPVVAPLRLLATLALLGLGVAVLGQAGCSNQSEGQRCSVENGNDDCQDGLICKSKDLLNGAQDSLCCPADSKAAVAPACRPPSQTTTPPAPTGDASTSDASTDSSTDASVDGSTSDATSDSSTDSSTDASSDAPEGG